MKKYNPQQIEKKWQKYWEDHQTFKTPENPANKQYILDMLPYVSAAGLHVGHPEGYTATDILSRYLRMKGFDVLHPMGWDAFGLPTENYAIKTGVHPEITTQKSIDRFREQIKAIGLSYDWDREVSTADPDYYKWTQWLFLLFYKNGLAYKKEASVNWCPKDNTVLANEQVVNGHCERCGTKVVQKLLSQWFFKISDYTERLLQGLDQLDWPDPIKAMQRNWIGKREGAEIEFKIDGSDENIRVFTTRPDTIFGVTYLVIAPEHPFVQEIKDKLKNAPEVQQYIERTQAKQEQERLAEGKEKTGVDLKGVKAVNPANGELIPVWAADYVLGNYGTGAVMGVPGHDQRDFEFAKKYELPIRVVVKQSDDYEGVDQDKNKLLVKNLYALAESERFSLVLVGGIAKSILTENNAWFHSDVDVYADKVGFGEIKKYLTAEGFQEKNPGQNFPWQNMKSFDDHKGGWVDVFLLERDDNGYFDTTTGQKFFWGPETMLKKIKFENTEVIVPDQVLLEKIYHNHSASVNQCLTGMGIVYDSGKFNGMKSEEAIPKMAEEFGKATVQYKLRDWLVSRQRYWGAPIPIIYCDKCGPQAVPEQDLPVVLPKDVDFLPTGESPLARSKEFHQVTCPSCHAPARRDSDTMDTFVDSSWYFYRYVDPNNDETFADKKKMETWLPVDTYVGGAEHAVLHLLYSRFFAKVLFDLKFVKFEEPFLKLRNQGLILGPDGEKMSKSRGNVVNPDDIIAEFGADSLRMYEMFLGPLEDAKPWNTNGLIGLKRFLERVWFWAHENKDKSTKDSETVVSGLNKLIKKVTDDIVSFHFNTAISSFMQTHNEIKNEPVSRESLITFLTLLYPFAPHIAEELYEVLGGKESLQLAKWPEYDPAKAAESMAQIIIQVNGKVKDKLEAPVDATEDELKQQALASEKVKTALAGAEPKRVVVVPGRLVNIVL